MVHRHLSLLIAALLACTPVLAQLTLRIVVEDGDASTSCTDAITGPDPMWGVSVEGGPWAYFPQFLVCYTPLPHVAFEAQYDCPGDLPATVELCLRAFENDPDIFAGCDINPDCLELTCASLPVSLTPATHLVEMPDGLTSDGWAQIRIEVTGTPIDALNDLMCTAQDMGTLTFGQTLGDATAGGMSNFCGTSIGDPNPFDEAGVSWHNNVGVWYRFTTGPDISDAIRIRALNDPLGLGDTISLQLGLYTTDDGTCTGTPQWVAGAYDPLDYDETLLLQCALLPNTTYYLLVDGVIDQEGTLHGYFGLEISDLGAVQGGNLRCAAEDLGVVPAGGQVSSALTTNFCADDSDDPPATGFPAQQTVWFRFVPPPSGHVRIIGTSHPADPIGLQLALYTSSTDDCSGTFFLQDFAFEPDDEDEVLELSCLENRPYFLLVDGSNANTAGIFTIAVEDGGFDGPVLAQNITLCAGDTLHVGNSLYTTSGTYADTIALPDGCDSVVVTELTVLAPILPNVAVIRKATAPGIADGIVAASPTGGGGGYTFAWSSGATTDTASNLTGDQMWCLTVTDTLGCTADTCFTMPVVPPMQVTAVADTLDCADDTEGRIALVIRDGFPPYEISWQGATLSGNAALPQPDTAWIMDLPKGDYQITVTDGVRDTTLTVTVAAPPPLNAAMLPSQPSCYGFCDGAIEVLPEGGTPPYTMLWADGDTSAQRADLCAGTWALTLTDANACTLSMAMELQEPPEFIATIVVTDEINCAGGADGALGVQTNDQPGAFLWNTGDTTAIVSHLPKGDYQVTVTNADGCADTASITLDEPPPLTVAIEETASIQCYGQADGALQATADGPGAPFAYLWQDGQTGAQRTQLAAGTWVVTVTNAKGCTAAAEYLLRQPAPLRLWFTPDPIDCLEGPMDGLIYVDSAAGGTPPYQIAAAGRPFVPLSDVEGLPEGEVALSLRDANGCLLDTTTFIAGPPDFQVSLGAQLLEVELGETVRLAPQATSSDAVFSFFGDSLSCTACPTLEWIPLSGNTIVVTAVDTITHCTDSDTLVLVVRKARKFYAPNAFSPDGDGYNERFTLFGQQDVVAIELLQVFDRYGELVYEGRGLPPNNQQEGWNGTIRGRPAPTGVYVWRARIRFLDGWVQEYAGEVVLVR